MRTVVQQEQWLYHCDQQSGWVWCKISMATMWLDNNTKQELTLFNTLSIHFMGVITIYPKVFDKQGNILDQASVNKESTMACKTYRLFMGGTVLVALVFDLQMPHGWT